MHKTLRVAKQSDLPWNGRCTSQFVHPIEACVLHVVSLCSCAPATFRIYQNTQNESLNLSIFSAVAQLSALTHSPIRQYKEMGEKMKFLFVFFFSSSFSGAARPFLISTCAWLSTQMLWWCACCSVVDVSASILLVRCVYSSIFHKIKSLSWMNGHYFFGSDNALYHPSSSMRWRWRRRRRRRHSMLAWKQPQQTWGKID